MKITVYISQKDFDSFYQWVGNLKTGALCKAPVQFSFQNKNIKDPLKVFLTTDEYYLIIDNQNDLKRLENTYGSFIIQYNPDIFDDQLQRIRESLRNAQRNGLELQLIYNSLNVMKDLPSLNPSEAIIIAEKELLAQPQF